LQNNKRTREQKEEEYKNGEESARRGIEFEI
jgi:hypothetical protein